MAAIKLQTKQSVLKKKKAKINKNKTKNKIRRGGKHFKVKNIKDKSKMTIIGTNAAGLLNKKESFLRLINQFQPAVFMIQESKVRRKNKIKIPNYVTFEHVRKDKNGGAKIDIPH